MIDLSKIPSPCFVLEEKLLRKNLELLQYVQQQAGVQVICALKGYSFYHTFPLLKQYLAGATASSLHEAHLIVEEFGTDAHVYLPVYLAKEFNEIMSYASYITFNSWRQFEQFSGEVKQNAKKISMGIRVNPQYSEITTDMYNPCVAGSRLGVTRNQLPNQLPPEIEGLHFHTLCENDSYTLERTLEALEHRFTDLLHQVKWLNMGGGHLITSKGYDVEHLISVLRNFKTRFPHLKITLEPGSAVGWQTGFLTATIQDIIDSQGIMVSMLDVSFAAHMPDTLEMPYKPAIRGSVEKTDSNFTYRMGGLTCLAGDFMGDYSFVKPLQIGDVLILEDMIHYTMVKTTTFNGVNLPSIGIWKENDTFQLCRTFGYESYKDRLG